MGRERKEDELEAKLIATVVLLPSVVAYLAACAVQKVETPATPQPESITPDAEATLSRRDAQHGLVYGPWWYIPCPAGSTEFEFYNLVATQGEGPHAVSGGMNPFGDLNRLYVSPNKPNGIYEQEQRLKCYKDGVEVEVRGFRYRIFPID